MGAKVLSLQFCNKIATKVLLFCHKFSSSYGLWHIVRSGQKLIRNFDFSFRYGIVIVSVLIFDGRPTLKTVGLRTNFVICYLWRRAMRTRFLPVWFLAVVLMGVGLWQSSHDVARAATYYVTNNNDGGAGSLRAAVQSAADGDSVHVVTPGPIELNSTIAIAHSITIAGPEIAVVPTADPTTQLPLDTAQVAVGGIANSVNGSVFTIASGKSVVMSHLYITGGIAAGTTFSTGNGDPAYGGGIYNAGNLTLNYCTVSGNQAIAGNGGTASGNAGGIAYGGGIFSSGTLTLNQSTVDDNGALGGSGANSLAPYSQNAAYGGGIYSIGTTNINSSTISNNTAQGGASASSNGGSAVGGGVAQYTSGTLKLTNSTIANNLVKGGNGSSSGGSAVGGGVAVKNATLIPLNATITDNTVTAGTGGSPTTQGSGLAYIGSATLTINNSIIAGNTGSATDLDGAANLNGSYVNGAFSGSLGDNGGPTLTVAINGTGAVNAGDNTYSSSLSLDQRGAARLFNATVDAGAVEDGASFASVTPLSTSTIPFDFQFVNGVATFTQDQFEKTILPAGSLQSIVIDNIMNGELRLNGQLLQPGSVISIDDLDKLTLVQTDPNVVPSFDWHPSDNVNPVTITVNAQLQDDPPFVPVTFNQGIDNNPSLGANNIPDPAITQYPPLTNQIIYTNNPVTYTVKAQSVVAKNTINPAPATSPALDPNRSVTLTVHETVYNNGVITASSSWSDTGTSSTTTATVSVSSGFSQVYPGLHVINITARNIHNVYTTYETSFLLDQIPTISNQGSFTSPQTINLGDTFTQQLEGADPDYYIPSTSTSPDRLQFRVDQVCYGTNGACDTNNTATNIGSFSDSNLTGRLPEGTTLSTKFSWKPTQPGKYGIKVSLTDYWGYNDSSYVFTLFVDPPAAPVITNPGDQTAQLNSPFNLSIHATGGNLTYSASNLPAGLTINSSTGEITGTPTALGTNAVTVTVNDGINSPVSTTFNITVINGDAPVITNPTEGSTIFAPVDAPYDFPVQATDPNGDPLTYDDGGTLPSWAQIDHSTGHITSINPAGPSSSDVASTPVTVSVSDGTYTTTVHFTLSVVVGNPPTISISPSGPYNVTTGIAIPAITATAQDVDAGENLTFSLGSGAPSGLSLSQTTFTNVAANTPVQTTLQWTPTSSQVGTYTFNVVVTNSESLSATVPVTFNVSASSVNHTPTVQNPGTWTTSVNSFSTFSVFANDSDGDTLTYTPTNMPAWVVLTPSSAGVILSGTPGPGDDGTTNVTIGVSDGVNPAVSVPFQIVVSGNGVPSLAATPTGLGNPEQVTLGEGYSKIFVSHDSDYPETLTFNAVVTQIAGSGGNVGDATLTAMYESGDSSSGTTAATKFDWTPDTAGTYKVVMSVTDGDGNTTSQTFSIHVSSPPKIQVNGSTTPVTLNATPELPLTIPVAVSDPDDHETLTVSKDFNAPSTMTFSGSSTFSDVPGNTPKFATLTYTPDTFEANFSYTFNVTVTDSAGLTATQTVTINVGAVNARPIISSPTSGSTENVVTGHAVNLPVIATDAEGDTLTYSATGLPAGLSIDATTGVISGTVTAASGNNTVTVSVDDGKHIAPAASVTFTIAVGSTNHDPTLDPIADQTLTIGQTLNVQANGSDPDHDSLTYSQTGLPASWATFDTSTGIIGGVPASGDEGSWLVTVTVSDGYGGSASQSFTLRVTGPFSSTVATGSGYETITYTVVNTTANTISPVVRGNLTGGGYLDNENAFFSASQGFVDDQWANPVLQRKLDPTKNTRILTWTVGDLAPGAGATLTISVPIKGNTPHNTQLTNTWTVDYGSTHYTVSPVTHP